MAEKKEETFETLLLKAQEYVNTRIEIIKLSSIEKGAKLFANIITDTTVIICFVLAFFFGTIAFGFYLSDILHSNAAGFGCIALIYVLISLVVFFTKDKYLEKKIINVFIKKYFDKVSNEEDEEV